VHHFWHTFDIALTLSVPPTSGSRPTPRRTANPVTEGPIQAAWSAPRTVLPTSLRNRLTTPNNRARPAGNRRGGVPHARAVRGSGVSATWRAQLTSRAPPATDRRRGTLDSLRAAIPGRARKQRIN
jgi:hypothetical protein